MKRILLALMATLPLVMLSANVAASDASSKKDGSALQHDKAEKKAKAEAKKAAKDQAKRDAKQAKKDKKFAKKQQAHSVPEIDAAGAALALGLLGGIAAIRRERRKSVQK